jgi:hypothetical protein
MASVIESAVRIGTTAGVAIAKRRTRVVVGGTTLALHKERSRIHMRERIDEWRVSI